MKQAEKARITFHRVEKCGFYTFGGKAPTFGGLLDMCADLKQWGEGTDLSVTKLVDFESGADDLPVYMMDAISLDGDWLVSLWNQTPSAAGSVLSIDISSKVGAAPKVHENGVKENTIPGFPTYFYFVPAENVVAAVTFDNGASRFAAMQDYMRRFLQMESSHGRREGSKIIGYAAKPEDLTPVPGMHARFNLAPYTKGGKRKLLLENSGLITKVHRRGHLSISKAVDKNWFQSMVGFVRGDINREEVDLIHSLEVSLEYTPTHEELVSMIEAEEADGELQRWDRMGFDLKGEAQTIWIDRSRASATFDLMVERKAGLVSLKSLAEAINAKRLAVLQLLDDA